MKRAPRVLIVDDTEVVRLTVRDVLFDFGCAFSEADNGSSALTLMSEAVFDVIFLDLKLPDISGMDILAEARRRKVSAKVIVLTGLPAVELRVDAERLGAFAFLTKSPLDWQQVRSAFADAMGGSSVSQPAALQGLPNRAIMRDTKRRPRRSRPAAKFANDPPRPRLLVLDDSLPWLETIEQMLGRDFDLSLTTSAEEAYKKAKRQDFALAVLDMRLLGGISGLDVLSRMRRTNPGLRAIILTAHPDFESAVESGRRGALDYLSKHDVASLASTVTRILSEGTSPLRVFLSYDAKDRPAVSRLYERLMRRGFLPWMDVKNISAGRKWEAAVKTAIDQSDYFVLCVSRNSRHNEGFLRRELQQAMERQAGLLNGIFVIVARLDDCAVPEPFHLFQYADLFKREGFNQLVQALSVEAHSAVRPHPDLAAVLPSIRTFLEDVSLSLSQKGPAAFEATTRVSRLEPFEPLSVFVSTDPTTSADVAHIVEVTALGRRESAGILIYQQRPDTLARIRIAQSRLEDRFWLIPIPYPEVDRAVRERASIGLLSEYADRYLPGADLFGDMNAIGDTFSFFGRADVLKVLKDELLQVQGVGLFGMRKSGKTSVLLQLPHIAPGHPVVHVDLEPFVGAQRFAAILFNRILTRLTSYVPGFRHPNIDPDLPAVDASLQFTDIFSDMVNALENAGHKLPVLCFLDEVDCIIPRASNDPGLSHEFNSFFGALRALSQQHRTVSILVADVHPDCNRINRWHPEAPANPVFSFFKEFYLKPFSRDETDTMLLDIGRLMSRHFDTETLGVIHFLSGGHPFISRQLASLVAKTAANDEGRIEFRKAGKQLSRAIHDSSFLRAYIRTVVWDDHTRRASDANMSILRLLACRRDQAHALSESIMFAKLTTFHQASDVIDARIELEDLGLIQKVETSGNNDAIQLSIGLLTEWIRAEMREEEIERWQNL